MSLSKIDLPSISGLGYGFKNRIINGAMTFDQRNSGAAVTMSNAVVYNLDRWWSYEDTDGTMTAQQSSVAPTGFTKSLLCTTTVADASLSATQRVVISQAIEGYNIADLGWGSAGAAAAVTLSFWVRSSLTGLFGGACKGGDNRSYPFSYTISAANTWEYKTVTIAGDTTSTWNTTNGTGFNINFGLGVGTTNSGTAGAWVTGDYNSCTGATSVIGTSGATFYITGVQLEKGTVATSFDWRPYGTELNLCQRYYYKSYSQSIVPGTASAQPTNSAWVVDITSLNRIFYVAGAKFAVTMRAYPTTVTYYAEDGTANSVSAYNNAALKLTISSTPSPTDNNLSGYLQLSSNATAGMPYVFSFTASAEL